MQHAQQCALEAKKSGQPDHVVLGAFLHDIGHLIGMEKNMKQMEAFGITLGIMTHEKIGETFFFVLFFTFLFIVSITVVRVNSSHFRV